MAGSAGGYPSSEVEGEVEGKDEASSSEGSLSDGSIGTTWGGEAGGEAGSVAGWAMNIGTAKKGAVGSNKGLNRGTAKSRQKKCITESGN